jgi:hypothetical protein
MDAIRNEIAERLTVVPDHRLGEVLSYLNYLVWRDENLRREPHPQESPEDNDWLESDISSLDSYEPYEWQEGELQEGLEINV